VRIGLRELAATDVTPQRLGYVAVSVPDIPVFSSLPTDE
jgi:hypothetical protein